MSKLKKTDSNPNALPSKDRRLQSDAAVVARIVRAMRGWLRRPVGVYRLDGNWRAGLVERRRAPGDALALRGLLDDLQVRLQAQESGYRAAVLGDLQQLHDQMRIQGWAAVLALPDAMRAQVLFQARILAQESPYPVLTQLIEGLRSGLPTPAGSPRQQALVRAGDVSKAEPALEVSESSPEEFEAEASQAGWLDTVPPWQPHVPTPTVREPSP